MIPTVTSPMTRTFPVIRTFTVLYAGFLPPVHSTFVGDDGWLVPAFLHSELYTRLRMRSNDTIYDLFFIPGLHRPRNAQATHFLRASLVSGVEPERLPAIHGTAVLIERTKEPHHAYSDA
jgi:hypothetical protein